MHIEAPLIAAQWTTGLVTQPWVFLKVPLFHSKVPKKVPANDYLAAWKESDRPDACVFRRRIRTNAEHLTRNREMSYNLKVFNNRYGLMEHSVIKRAFVVFVLLSLEFPIKRIFFLSLRFQQLQDMLDSFWKLYGRNSSSSYWSKFKCPFNLVNQQIRYCETCSSKSRAS